MDKLIVFLALGLGTGRSPVAPGTVGSLLGLVWLFALGQLTSVALFLFLVFLSFFAGVWICTRAEEILKLHDPGCVVLDEILALPVAGLGWLAWQHHTGMARDHVFPLAGWEAVGWSVVIFALFRLFDIAKPWPVGPSQNLAKGWGVMSDDFLAGLMTALVSFLGRWLLSLL